jgi:nitrogen fixation protein
LPSGWTEVAGNGIRLATFVPPGGLETKVTVVSLPSDSGGELANANRWRGQLGLAPTDEAGMAAARTTFATKAGLAKIYDFTGTGEVRTRMIVAAIDTGGTIWFFKLMGEAAATESAHGDFLALIKGLKPDAAK